MAGSLDAALESLATVLRLLLLLTWPFVKFARGLALLLSPVWTLAHFVFLPITVVVQALLTIVLFPLRLNLLDRFQTIYIYLGIASLIGFLAGAMLYLAFNLLTSALRIDSASATFDSGSESSSNSRRPTRTTIEYRAERNARKGIPPPSAPNPSRAEIASRRQQGLLAQTIIEEDDSDF